MKNLSEIISKQVLNLYSGKIEGTIYDATFDKNLKRITSFKIFDEQEEEYLLSVNKIYHFDEEMCVIKNSEALELQTSPSQTDNPIGKAIYSTTGKHLGRVTDIEINQNFQITNLITSNTPISPSKIINIASNIIVNLENKKITLNMLKPKITKTQIQPQNMVSILPKIESSSTLSQRQTETLKIKPSFLPQKISTSTNFLIGRKALKTIYGINNEILIKKDSIITSKNLDTIKKHSKITELALFSKQKA